MDERFNPDLRRAVRLAQARADHDERRMRLTQADLAGCDWLVATHRGLFGVGPGRVVCVAHGWFFGMDRTGQHVYLFENCGHRDASVDHGRIVRLDLAGTRIVGTRVLVSGLHNNGHQLKMIGGLLCLVDTANQRILRFTAQGAPVDVQTPFPVAPSTDTSGAYLHCNSLARIGGRIALVLHNGKAMPERPSELAWLDADWRVTERSALPGRGCHDVVADEVGVLWHCASLAGAVIASDGRRVVLSDRLMTRGLALRSGRMLVGLSSFGPRQLRDGLGGALVLLDRDLMPLERWTLPSGPADLIAL